MTGSEPRPRILVIDDQRFQRRMLLRLLMQRGVGEVLEAADGRSAQKVLEACGETLTLIISDVDMPAMDGLEFLRWLAEAAPRTPVAIHSALDRALLESVETMATEYGVMVVGIIEKPATPEILAQILVRAERRRAEHVAVNETHASEADVAVALERGELEPWYQPQIDLRTGAVCGAEALARWHRPDGSVLSPASFIPAVMASGLIRPLTWHMAARAAEFLAAARDVDPHSTIALNVCPTLLDDPGFGEQLHAIMTRARVRAERVVLEVTESATASNRGAALENLTRLRMRGFTMSIDDFGTGFSSLTQLVRTPFTELKIDRSFVGRLEPGNRERLVVESTLAMAQRLGLRTVAEGVETAAQRDTLRALGCELAQGYFFARPMPLEQWLLWRKQHQAVPPDGNRNSAAALHDYRSYFRGS